MKRKLRTKDLLNLGIFGTIYAAILAIAGVTGASTPVLVFVTLVIAAFVNGTIFMLYLTRVDRFGMVFVLGLLMGAIMMAVGKSWTVLLTTFVFGLLTEGILAAGRYRNRWLNVLAYAVFSLWYVGPLLPILWFTKSYFEEISSEQGADYAQSFLTFFSLPMVVGFGAAVFVASFLGGLLGNTLIRKHFARSGIVSATGTVADLEARDNPEA